MDRILEEVAIATGWTRHLFGAGWIQEFRKGEKRFRIYGYDFPLGDYASHALARDKAAASELLQKYDVPCVPHRLILSEEVAKRWYGLEGNVIEAQLDEAITAFGKDLVLKPNLGQAGHGVVHVSSREEALAYLQTVFPHQRDYAVSPFIAKPREIRVILLHGEPLCMFEKQLYGEEWRHNLAHGATAVPVTEPALQKCLVDLARQACHVLSLPLASVDIFVTKDEHRIIEMNSGIAVDKMAEQLPEGNEIARHVYQAIFTACVSDV